MKRGIDINNGELELHRSSIRESLYDNITSVGVVPCQQPIDQSRVYAPRANAEEELEAKLREGGKDIGLLVLELCGCRGD